MPLDTLFSPINTKSIEAGEVVSTPMLFLFLELIIDTL